MFRLERLSAAGVERPSPFAGSQDPDDCRRCGFADMLNSQDDVIKRGASD